MFQRTKVGLPVIQIKFLAKNTEVDFSEIVVLLHNMLLYVLDELLSELRIWIKKKVPKRTGQLQDNLLKNLESSNVKKGLMRLVLGTNIDYAPEVAEMSTSQVRHFGEKGYAYYYGEHGPIMLNDPQAIGDFWNELIDYAQEITMNILQRAIDEYFAGTGKLMRKVRGAIS